MKRIQVFWLATLCLFLMGCSGSYQTIPLLTDAADVESRSEERPDLKAGDRIRLTQQDSSRVEGKFSEYRGQTLIMYQVEAVNETGTGFDEIHGTQTTLYAQTVGFPLAEISTIEKYESVGPPWWVNAGLLVVGVVGFVSMLDNTLSGSNN